MGKVRHNNGSGFLVYHHPGNRARVVAVLATKEDAKKLSDELGGSAFFKEAGKADSGRRDPLPETTNEDFAKQDRLFKKACELAEVEATPRQASRWRNGTGAARRFFRDAKKAINREGPQ